MKRKIIACLLLIVTVFFMTGINAYAKKPEVTRHDAQYVDKQLSINLQWQSSESIVSIRVAAGKEIKEVKVDPFDNKRNRSGYTGEVNVVLQAEPSGSQDIPYTIQLEDEDGQKSVIAMGKAAIPPSTAGGATEDTWGKEKLASSQQSVQKDMIEQVRTVAQALISAPFLQEVTVNNPGGSTVTFKTKINHSAALKEINFRVIDGGNKMIDNQQISTTGKMWEGTSKDFSLMNGNYIVVAQAVDGTGNTSPERRANFTITGSSLTQNPTPSPTTPTTGTQDSLILTVNIMPADVVPLGAQWRVVGTQDWKSNGDSITSLTAGSYNIEFKEVAGWTTAPTTSVTLSAGQSTTSTGAYTQIPTPTTTTSSPTPMLSPSSAETSPTTPVAPPQETLPQAAPPQ